MRLFTKVSSCSFGLIEVLKSLEILLADSLMKTKASHLYDICSLSGDSVEDHRRSSLGLKEMPVPWSRRHIDAIFLSVTVEQIHVGLSGRLCYQQVFGGIEMF